MTLAVKRAALATRPAFPEIGVQNARVGFFEPAWFEFQDYLERVLAKTSPR